MEYKFDPKKVYFEIFQDMCNYFKEANVNKAVLGISGGKDSTVTAKLACDVLGSSNVIGVTLPCGIQKDISDSYEIIDRFEIKSYEINIEEAFNSIVSWIDGMHGVPISKDTKINLPARLRMAALFAVAQSNDAMVLCTSNLSEIVVGYGTFGGDDFGSYAPLKNLTVTEVKELGKFIGIPSRLIDKTPSDGLQELSDEDKLGFKYDDLDKYIRTGVCEASLKDKIDNMYRKNKFKSDIVKIPGPKFDNFSNFVEINNKKD